MRILQLSSGDLVADRRASYAALLADEGDHAAAAELIEQALELAPGWVAGWCLLGDYRSEAGNVAGAVEAYRELMRLDGAGLFGAALKLAAHWAAPTPQGTEIGYVEGLFDDYAGRFETELVEGLGYTAPARLAAMVEAELGGPVALALDLGCGTGLMGERLRHHAAFLEGVDLSSAMLEEAGRKGVYDRLEKAELTAFLTAHPGSVDLMTAADVLNYCGALPPIFAAARACLAPGGLFALTLELHDGHEPLVLRPSLRYAHSAAAARGAAADAGLDIVAMETAPLRHDRGEPVQGLLVVLRKPANPALAAEPANDNAEPDEPAVA